MLDLAEHCIVFHKNYIPRTLTYFLSWYRMLMIIHILRMLSQH
uniref:Uncharacterized protein n=1 Tax=Arundo donax TaxID=35708 RepID=A0A0A8Z950_ARUDO